MSTGFLTEINVIRKFSASVEKSFCLTCLTDAFLCACNLKYHFMHTIT